MPKIAHREDEIKFRKSPKSNPSLHVHREDNLQTTRNPPPKKISERASEEIVSMT